MLLTVLISYIIVGILFATANEEQLSLSGSGQYVEPPQYIQVINCDSYLDSECSISLEWIMNNVTESSLDRKKFYIHINVSQLMLKTNFKLFELESLTITGNPDLNTTLTCEKGNFTGLTFYSINRLELRQFTVVNCGGTFNHERSNYSSAITILHCRDFIASNLIIINSTGIGMTILDHQGGFVQITSSTFSGNKVPRNYSDHTIKGGGGVYVGGFKQDPDKPITFQFDQCTFERNVAHTRYYDYLYTNDLGQPVSGHGNGGGVVILLERGLTDIHVVFSGCVFAKNEAFKGAGLLADIEGSTYAETRNMSVRVENSLFEENGCSSSNLAASGGGASLDFSSHNKTNFDTNKYVLYNVTFYKNCAEFGGGLYFYSEYLDNAALSNTIDIEKCTFIGNHAHTGSAVDITPNVFERLLDGIFTTPVFRDCMFSNNEVRVNFKVNHNQTTYGIGTMYISLFDVKFEGHNTFENNLGTAIHIVNGNIDMSESSLDFIDNHGIRGGAVALIGESSMILGRARDYKFLNNTAMDKGGAVFFQAFDNHDITASKTCFIQYNIPARKRNATVKFIGNRADTGIGHSIFATSLYPCQTIYVGKTRKGHKFKSILPADVFSERGIDITRDTTVKGQQIATEGAILYDKGYPLEVIPGEQFAHGVTIKDDLNQDAKVELSATIPNGKNVKIDSAFSSCIGEKLVLKGKPGEYANLYLHTTTSRLSYIRLSIKLIDCPPGFIYREVSSKCICISQEYIGLLRCNTTFFYSYISSGFWIGMLSDAKNKSRMELVTSYCPQSFCNYNMTNSSRVEIRLPQRYSQLNESQCGKSRTGVACGSCASGYTTYFHSPNYHCKAADSTLCKVGWLFYVLSELVPVTAVFILVVTLNISFTSGSVQGFVLFSQLLTSLHIDASGIIIFPRAIAQLSEGYRLLYGFFNLDFFQIESLSFCLWHDATALDMLAFKYVTILYALVLVIVVIWFMNKCGGKCLGKWFRITTVKSSVIHGISAFLILCYSQCVRVSLNLLNAYTPFVRENSNLTVVKRVWLNGDIEHYSRSHLPYALPATFCLLLFGVVPPLLLLAYPLSNKVFAFLGIEKSTTCIYQKFRLSSLKPLLDSFQGSFKDNMRFFAGLYFLYRWITLILTTILTDFNNIYVAVEIFFVIILVLHALCQPYASNIHNMVDTLLLGNLALINAITFAHFYSFRTNAGKQAATTYIAATAAIQLVLIYLPLLIMVVYIFVLICQLAYKRVDEKNAEWTNNSIALQKLMSSFSKEDDADDELPHRLTAPDADYKCFNQANHTANVQYCNIDNTY